jgi:hypothetical protein
MAGGMKGKAKPPSDSGDGGFGKDLPIGDNFGTYDANDSAWLRGYVGGEVPGGKTRFGDVGDWDGDEGKCCGVDSEGHAPGFSKADRARGYKTP